MNPACGRCTHETDGKFRCSACKAVYYCNQECQKVHWPSHKLLCKKIQTQAGHKELGKINQDTIARFITMHLVDSKTYDQYLTKNPESKKYWRFTITDPLFFEASDVVQAISEGRSPPIDKMVKVIKSVQIVQVDALPLELLGLELAQADLEKVRSVDGQPMTYVLLQYKEAVVMAILENVVIFNHITAFCRQAGFKS